MDRGNSLPSMLEQKVSAEFGVQGKEIINMASRVRL